MPIKGTSKTSKKRTCWLFTEHHSDEYDTEPGISSLSAYEISKKVIHLLRHSQQVRREEDGAVHFWRMKIFRTNAHSLFIGLTDDRWKVCLAAGGGAKRRFLYCTDDNHFSELFKDIQGAILLILLYRTMFVSERLLPAAFIMSDVQSIYILSSTQD